MKCCDAREKKRLKKPLAVGFKAQLRVLCKAGVFSLPFPRLPLLPLLHLHTIFSSPSSLFLAVPISSTAIVSIMASDAQKQI